MKELLTEMEFATALSQLKGKRFPLLSKGGLTLIDASAPEQRVAQAARTTSNIQAKGDKDDRNLLRYLMRHNHWTPVEFVDVIFLFEMPMDCLRQHVRHRASSMNEFSSRYSEVPDVNDVTPHDGWRLQSTQNRQGSSGQTLTEWPEYVEISDDTLRIHHDIYGPNGEGDGYDEYHIPDLVEELGLKDASELTPGRVLSLHESEFHEQARYIYQERLKFGVAKEVARKDLPLSTYTRFWWKSNLRNLLHYLGLRMDSHAQLEIRLFANQMHEVLAQLYPVTMEAFRHYQLDALPLTALDIETIQCMNRIQAVSGVGEQIILRPPYSLDVFMAAQSEEWRSLEKCRERDECLVKLRRLGLVEEPAEVPVG